MFVIKHLKPAKNVKITSRSVSTIAEKFRNDGFIQKYEVNSEGTKLKVYYKYLIS